MENARSGRSKLGRLATSMRRKQLNKFSTSSTYTFRINLFRRCSRLLRGRRGLVMMVRIAPAYILRHEKLLDLSSSFSFEVPLPLRLTTKKVLYCTRTDTSNGQFFSPTKQKNVVWFSVFIVHVQNSGEHDTTFEYRGRWDRQGLYGQWHTLAKNHSSMNIVATIHVFSSYTVVIQH